MSPCVTIAVATSSDIDEIRSFYKNNSRHGVRSRPDQIIEKTIENGNFYIVRDSEAQVVGSAACFEFPNSDFYEVGAVLIILNGFHLQRVLNYCCIVSHFLFNNSVPTCSVSEHVKLKFSRYFCVVSEGTTSHTNQQAVGFTKWKPPENLYNERAQAIGAWAEEKIELGLPEQSLSECARRLLLLHRDKKITRSTPTRDGLNALQLKIEVPLLTSERMRRAVHELAEAKFER